MDVPLPSLNETVPASEAVAPAPAPAITPATPPRALATALASRSAMALKPLLVSAPASTVLTLPVWEAVAVTTPTAKAPAVAPVAQTRAAKAAP